MAETKFKWVSDIQGLDKPWKHLKVKLEDGTEGQINSKDEKYLKPYIEAFEKGLAFTYTAEEGRFGGKNIKNVKYVGDAPEAAASPKSGGGNKPYKQQQTAKNEKWEKRDNYWEGFKPAFDEKMHEYTLVRDKKIEFQFYFGQVAPFYLELFKGGMNSGEYANAKKAEAALGQCIQKAFAQSLSIYQTVVEAAEQVKAAEQAEASKQEKEAPKTTTKAKASKGSDDPFEGMGED